MYTCERRCLYQDGKQEKRTLIVSSYQNTTNLPPVRYLELNLRNVKSYLAASKGQTPSVPYTCSLAHDTAVYVSLCPVAFTV